MKQAVMGYSQTWCKYEIFYSDNMLQTASDQKSPSHHPCLNSCRSVCSQSSMAMQQELIDWRYLPFVSPIFQAYVMESPHKMWPENWYKIGRPARPFVPLSKQPSCREGPAVQFQFLVLMRLPQPLQHVGNRRKTIGKWNDGWMEFHGIYSLVNCHITMKNHPF